jgi:hypothetical protein
VNRINQRSSTRKRNPSVLPAGLDKNLLAYATAASAAGVAILACATPAEARIVATKANITVPVNGGVIQFDINGDGQADFGLSVFALGGCTSTTSARLRHGRPNLGCPFDDQAIVIPEQAGNEVWQAKTSYGAKCAAALPFGAQIGAPRPFGSGKMVMAAHTGTSEGHYFCPWTGPLAPHPYLGVKFTDTSGNVHFGWVRVKVEFETIVTILGYAYETVPGRPIHAGQVSGPDEAASLIDPTDLNPNIPEVASLGRLAQGAAGLSAWRRRDQQVETSIPVGSE